MKPMFVVEFFEIAVEARSTKVFVDDFERGKDAGKKLFKGEGCEAWGKEVVERCGWGWVGGVDANADDEVVVAS